MNVNDKNDTPLENTHALKYIAKEILTDLTVIGTKVLRSRRGVYLSKDNNPEDVSRQFEAARKRIPEIEEKALKKLKDKKTKIPKRHS